MARKPNPCPCGARYGTVNFECVPCCLKWLAPLTAESLRINAPMIAKIAGSEQLDIVRKAYAAAGMAPARPQQD